MTKKIKLDSIEPVYQVEDNIAENGARSPKNLKLKKKKKLGRVRKQLDLNEFWS